VEGVDQDPGVRPVDGREDGSGGGEVTGLGPRGELEVDADAEVEGQVAEAAEAVGGGPGGSPSPPTTSVSWLCASR
jgi:hypothetical protein